MKNLIALLSLALCLCLLVSCAGTPVIYHADCDCPENGGSAKPNLPVPEGALKTGLSLVASTKGSANGEAKYDINMVAVLVDDNGVIQDCVIDSLGTSLKFNGEGQLSSDKNAVPQTKNELGDKYTMPSGSWKKQAEALADYVVGKTADEVGGIAVNAETRPTDADIASSVTMTVGGYIPAIQAAVKNAAHLGAMGGDELRLATSASFKSSKDATADADGNAQLDVDVTAITMKNGAITSCVLDAVQAKVAFSKAGAITGDVNAQIKTKTELGEDYKMPSGTWAQQAASFASYVTGKTPAEVAGIAVDAGTKPTGADLTSSVTIAVGGFQALIQKAAK